MTPWESMAKKRAPKALRDYLAEIGRKGGKAGKGKTGIAKGLATMDAERRREIALKGVTARAQKRETPPK